MITTMDLFGKKKRSLGFVFFNLLLVSECHCLVIEGQIHRDVLLPCIVTYRDGFNYNELVVNWLRSEDKTVVHAFYYNASQSEYQDKRYQHRTQIFYDQLPEGNASLLLRNLSYADTGKYICHTVITVETGFTTEYVILLVKGYQYPVAVVGRIHGDVLLPCIVTYADEFDYNELVVSWLRTEDDTVVHTFYYNASQSKYQNKRYQGRTQIFYDKLPDGNASLLMKDLSNEDTGNYTCQTVIKEETGYTTNYVKLFIEDDIEVRGSKKRALRVAVLTTSVLMVIGLFLLMLQRTKSKLDEEEKRLCSEENYFSEEKRLCSEENYFSVVIAKEKNIIWNGMNLPNDHYVARRLRIAKGSNFCISGSKQKYCFDEQNTIKSEELFTPRNKNLRSHRMLLVGGAGVGKTCLCKWLLKKWASGGELSYTCVLYLSLKQCDKKQISVKDLLDEKCKAASAILQNNPRDLLLILDDIDGLYCDEDKTSDSADDINTSLELKSLVTKIITKRFLPDTDVLIVSCVESMSKLQKHCSLSFIIQDFSDEEAMSYCNTIATIHKEAEHIIEKIKQTELSYFTKMPLQMYIVINFLSNQYSQKIDLNGCYTASGVLIYQLQQCLNKINIKPFTEVELKKISKLCFDNLIRSEKIKGNLYENVLFTTWHSNMFIFDRCNKCIEYQYELLRDMLAAVHCSWEIQSGEDVKECLNTWVFGYSANENANNTLVQSLVDEHHARFNNFTRFLMGLLHYPDYDSLVNYCPKMKDNIRESLVDWFRSKINLENQDLLKLFHCLFELHDEQVTSTVSDLYKTINLCNIPLSALDIQVLKYCLENSSLEETDLRLCGLRDEDVAQLQNIMKNTKCIRIGGNHLTEISGLILSKVLMDTNCVIEKLALGNNTLGTSGVEALLEALEHNTTLQHLYLYYNGIGGNSIKQMLMSLEKNNTLKELVLCVNPPVEDVEDIHEYIKTLKNVKKDLNIVLLITEDEELFNCIEKTFWSQKTKL